mmetsp:Transcript_31304/g.88744  ORF Transcript_31304/g.88744 Transcript_31304/m.88744 type:complete len:253 (-) Transcript_31304:180-938(-)
MGGLGPHDGLLQPCRELLHLAAQLCVADDRLLAAAEVASRPGLALEPDQVRLDPGDGFQSIWHSLLSMELREAPLHHVLHLEVLNSEEVENHRVRQSELALQACGSPCQHLPHLALLWKVLPAGDHNSPNSVEPAAPRSPCHLCVLAGEQAAKALPVMLASRVEDGGACRRIDAHRKCLRGKKNLYEALAEEHFHNLLHDWKEARVVHSQPALEHLPHPQHLREGSVRALETGEAALAEDMDLALLAGAGEV